MSRNSPSGYDWSGLGTKRRRADGGAVFTGVLALLVLIWWLVKIIFVPIFIVNAIYLLNALGHGTLGSFDWTWLVVSVVGLFIL